MPIVTGLQLRRLTQEAFRGMAFEVMREVFEIHKEFGRFFDEKIYKRELARRRADVRLEVPVDVSFESFRKRYLFDAVVDDGGLFAREPRCAVSASRRPARGFQADRVFRATRRL